MLELAECPRFVGIDLHKHFAVGAVAQHLTPQDAAVLEATGNAWWCYDIVAPHVGRCVVANPLEVKWIARAAVKTDKHDALKLARLLAANLIPEVWVPPVPVRELRALLSPRHALITHRTAAKHRWHSILHRHHLHPPAGDLFAAHHQTWWAELAVSATERRRARHDLATLEHVQTQLGDLHTELGRLSMPAPWRAQMPYLIQLPGFALLAAMTVLSAIGDVTRFPHARQLVGYAGLGAGVHDSGQSHRDGHITKAGRRLTRIRIGKPLLRNSRAVNRKASPSSRWRASSSSPSGTC